jgi:hypothetical protein
MQKLILVRFGNQPSPAVSTALKPHIVGGAFACPIPGAIMSVFNTESTKEEVAADVKETGVYFILMRADEADVNLPEELMVVIAQIVGEEPEISTDHRELTIDDILDLINENGIESLTPNQRRILDNRQ